MDTRDARACQGFHAAGDSEEWRGICPARYRCYRYLKLRTEEIIKPGPLHPDCPDYWPLLWDHE